MHAYESGDLCLLACSRVKDDVTLAHVTLVYTDVGQLTEASGLSTITGVI